MPWITRELIDVDQAPFTSQEVDDAVAFFTGVSPLRYATAEGSLIRPPPRFLPDFPRTTSTEASRCCVR